jgi:AbrB family looped-hinge helix DNA binding protein
MSRTDTATVTSKGQVTIPKAVRERLGLDAGMEVEFVVEDDESVVVRVKKPAMERLRDVQQTLDRHEVDLEAMRSESRRAWGSHIGREDSA